MKRSLSFILVLCMLLSTLMLCACPAPDDGGSTTTTTGGGQEGPTPSPWADRLDTEAVKKEIGGGELVVSCFERYLYEIYAEEDSKDTLDQLIYKRNKKIEERFAVTIKPNETKSTGINDSSSHREYVKTELCSLDPKFDLLMMMASASGRLIEHYHDWKATVPYARDSLAAGDAWWSAQINRNSTVKGRMFVAVSDMCITLTDLSFGVMFNQSLVNEYNLVESYAAKVEADYKTMYDIVNAGDWTLDSVKMMTKDLWIDNEQIGKSGAVDEEDIIGFYTVSGMELDNFFCSFGFTYLENDGVSDPTLWRHPSTFEQAVADLRSFFGESRGARLSRDFSWDLEERLVAFAEGHVFFMTAHLDRLQTATVKGMEQDYGILPYPKLNRDQAEYLTGCADNLTVLSVPRYIIGKRLKRAGAMTVALSAENSKSVNEPYYEMIVKHDSGFVNREDIDMLERIAAGRVHELAVYHYDDLIFDADNTHGTLGLYLRYLIMDRPTASPAGVWSEARDVIEGKLDELIRTYQDLPG